MTGAVASHHESGDGLAEAKVENTKYGAQLRGGGGGGVRWQRRPEVQLPHTTHMPGRCARSVETQEFDETDCAAAFLATFACHTHCANCMHWPRTGPFNCRFDTLRQEQIAVEHHNAISCRPKPRRTAAWWRLRTLQALSAVNAAGA